MDSGRETVGGSRGRWTDSAVSLRPNKRLARPRCRGAVGTICLTICHQSAKGNEFGYASGQFRPIHYPARLHGSYMVSTWYLHAPSCWHVGACRCLEDAM